ncbi:MAG: hypothetical protein U5N85_08555 [Arcicella sp.]|nr:hypothetical protein [Arcicella sp.]
MDPILIDTTINAELSIKIPESSLGTVKITAIGINDETWTSSDEVNIYTKNDYTLDSIKCESQTHY